MTEGQATEGCIVATDGPVKGQTALQIVKNVLVVNVPLDGYNCQRSPKNGWLAQRTRTNDADAHRNTYSWTSHTTTSLLLTAVK